MKCDTRLGQFVAMITLATALIIPIKSFAQSADENNNQKRYFSIGVGPSQSVDFILGNTICLVVNKEAKEGVINSQRHGLRCSSPSTADSNYNVRNVRNRELNFGITQSDSYYFAYTGTGPFAGDKHDNLRSVFSVYLKPYHLIVRQDSGIKSINDLRDKVLNVGAPGSDLNMVMNSIITGHQFSDTFFRELTEFNTGEAGHALCEGKIDAYSYLAAVPSPAVSELSMKCGAMLISLNTTVETNLVARSPYYTFAVILKDMYPTLSEDILTLAVSTTVVTSADEDEDLVYEVTRSVFENIDEFRKQHPAFRRLDVETMISSGFVAPLHPGALRYYRQKGWK